MFLKREKIPFETADKMFEKVGFIKTKVENEYQNENGIAIEFINKKVAISCMQHFDVFGASVYLHLAIHKKLIELGWIV